MAGFPDAQPHVPRVTLRVERAEFASLPRGIKMCFTYKNVDLFSRRVQEVSWLGSLNVAAQPQGDVYGRRMEKENCQTSRINRCQKSTNVMKLNVSRDNRIAIVTVTVVVTLN